MSKSEENKTRNLTSKDFGDNFIWGVSTAAYQIEGSHNKNGKSASIWDDFSSKKGTIYQDQDGTIACDFYERYKEDILLMKSMHITNFRFSISWTRILPNGVGEVNKEGVGFYNNVINFCLECGITPWVTLYHWDLPQILEDKGGWANREIVSWFSEFATVCATSFGDRVKNWMVLNEPMVFTGAGYFLGVHAPGKKGLKYFLPAVHHAVLCQAKGGRILRELVENATIGTTFSCSQITPHSSKKRDLVAAKKADAMLNRLFIEPSLGLGYPIEDVSVLKRIEKYCKPEDKEDSIFEFDFIGVQNYTREIVKHSHFVPYLKAKIIKASNRNVKITQMDWEVYPPSIYKMLKKFDAYPGVKSVIVTENGAAFNDVVVNEGVYDEDRTAYLQDYIKEVKRAKEKGVNVNGYFVWTFTDNFEWAEGYYPRFGLVHVDFETQKRSIKKSGHWYSKLIKPLKKEKPMETSV
ncbi:beta-glucosidase [Maribacter vaceletii]|uniref:Beta-glucosidase n=1 Tax=Maribacter vaceletii TaxID=1206816 RepID=A0A495ECN7_9FLAO|nr:GH1 family beta-glucosidase [Maribacter vaceletii]RKR14441.1 beta-glucosidase [Maribacter vaceletii]